MESNNAHVKAKKTFTKKNVEKMKKKKTTNIDHTS